MRRFSSTVGVIGLVCGLLLSGSVKGAGWLQEPPNQSGAIAGRVILPGGSPAAGVRVSVISAPEDAPAEIQPDAGRLKPGVPFNPSLIGLTKTDDDGRFHLDGIPSGRYLLALGEMDSPVYYPGVKTYTAAGEVVVLKGETAENVDFNLPFPLTHKIAGRVIRDRRDVGSTMILKNSPHVESAPFELRASIADDGEFEFQNVRPGTYQLRVAPNLTAPAPMTVTVDSEDVTDLKIPIPLTAVNKAPVTFKLIAPDGAPLPRLKLIFTPRPSALQPKAAFTISTAAHDQEMDVGVYRLTALNEIQLPSGYSIRSIMADSVDLTKAPLIVSRSGAPAVTITLAVSKLWVRAAGHITGLAKAPVRATQIRMGLPGFITPLIADITATGAFEFPYVPPGRHRVELEPAADAFSRVMVVGDAGTADARIPMFVPPVQVSGHIRALPAAEPPARILARLIPEPMAGMNVFVTAVGKDGAFVFPEVAPGRYQLSVVCDSRTTPGKSQCPAISPPRVLVVVNDRNIADLIVGDNALGKK